MKLRIVIPALILMLVGSVANAVTINTNVGDLNFSGVGNTFDIVSGGVVNNVIHGSGVNQTLNLNGGTITGDIFHNSGIGATFNFNEGSFLGSINIASALGVTFNFFGSNLVQVGNVVSGNLLDGSSVSATFNGAGASINLNNIAVPEPNTAVLAMIGVVGLVARRLRAV